MTPGQLAKESILILRKAGNPRDAAGAKAYFKRYEAVSFFGVKTPLQRKIERELYNRIKSDWSVSDAEQFCEILIGHPVHECKNIGIMLLSRFHRDFDKSLFRKAETWLRRNDCASWALVDMLSPLILTRLLLKYPRELSRLRQWTQSTSLWIRRASLVTLIPCARHGQLLDASYEFVLKLRKDKEDLIHKAAGWLLREAGKADPDRLESFLQRHGSTLPRTTIRYAIERFPRKTQKRLLLETK